MRSSNNYWLQLIGRDYMMQPKYYILVAADADKSRLSMPSAYDIAHYRLKTKRWGINTNTRNRTNLKAGDYALIYASGLRENGKSFIASARLESGAEILPHRCIGEIDGPNNLAHLLSGYSIKLTDINYFNKRVDIRNIKSLLSFVKNPDSPRWGGCLQGGCITISEKDFQLACNLST